jgi:ATP-binding cassette subfamily G (WHITE) protein 2 (PDR)
MADSDSNMNETTWVVSSSHQETHYTSDGANATNTIGQSTTSTTHTHPDGVYRTSSGRETYYPDGHESRTRGTGAGLFCDHHEHQPTPMLNTRNSYGLFPAQESTRVQQSSESQTINGTGAFVDHNTQREQLQSSNSTQEQEEVVPLEKVESSNSSDSSTRYGSNGPHKRKQSESSNHDREMHGAMLERRVTRSEIDDEGRRELQRIFTTQSQKMSRQISIAQPGDATVDPSSDAFDLSKFLRMFREYFEAHHAPLLLIPTLGHNLEGEGVEMKKLSVVYRDLNVFGSGRALQLQKTVADVVMAPFRAGEYFGKSERKQILHNFDGIIKAGELCVVLGRPGSGCSTLLKSLTGELHGLDTDKSTIHYNGIPQSKIRKEFKGETVYNQEVDKHFPHLTVGQTLEHAAALRTPSNRPMGQSREEFSKFITSVVMAVLGLSHTYNTKVGDDFVRGVSGGERKRVSVAEMMLAGAPFASWDNSTRGLDSATALKFVKALRVASDMADGAAAVAIYQASQSVYDQFDKAAVLYEGRQISSVPPTWPKATLSDKAGIAHRGKRPATFLPLSPTLLSAKPRKAWITKFHALQKTLRSTGAIRKSTRICSKRSRTSRRRILSTNTPHSISCESRRRSFKQNMLAPSLRISSVFPCKSSSTPGAPTSASGAMLHQRLLRPVSMSLLLSLSVLSTSVTLKVPPPSKVVEPSCSWLFCSMRSRLLARSAACTHRDRLLRSTTRTPFIIQRLRL